MAQLGTVVGMFLGVVALVLMLYSLIGKLTGWPAPFDLMQKLTGWPKPSEEKSQPQYDFYADDDRRLDSAPIINIVGIVAGLGVTGARPLAGELAWLHFSFNPWRIRNRKLETRKLRISRKVNEEEFNEFRRLIRPYSILHIKARAIDPIFGPAYARLEEVIGVDTSDAELNHALELQNVVSFEDPILGTFTRSMDSYDAECAWTIWNGKGVSLNLHAGDATELQQALSTAHALWQSQADWDRRVFDFTMKEFLPLFIEEWAGEDQAATTDEFTKKITLSDISIYPEGELVFFYEDGDLFGGHSLVIRASISDGPTYANMEG